MSTVLETTVHYLDSKHLQNLLSSYLAPRPHLAVLSALVIVEAKAYATVMTLAKPYLSSAYVSQHVSHDEIYQAFSPLFVLQATKSGRGGLGMRLGCGG